MSGPEAHLPTRSGPAPRSWNLIVTSLEGQRDLLRLALKRLGRFRGSGIRNLLLGEVDDPIAFLPVVRDALAVDRALQVSLGKVIPIERMVRFEVETAVDTLTAAAEPFLDRIAGGSFFVRYEQRRMNGQLHASEVERAVGERLFAMLAARGASPKVDFKRADHVVVIEGVGNEAGLALLPRALREAFPFVRVK